jgi:hypothetical protein
VTDPKTFTGPGGFRFEICGIYVPIADLRAFVSANAMTIYSRAHAPSEPTTLPTDRFHARDMSVSIGGVPLVPAAEVFAARKAEPAALMAEAARIVEESTANPLLEPWRCPTCQMPFCECDEYGDPEGGTT